MDRNTVTGLVIIGLLLLGYTWYNGKQIEEFNQEKLRRDSIELAQAEAEQYKILERQHAERAESLALKAENGEIIESEVTGEITEKVEPTTPIEAYFGEYLHNATKAEEEIFVVENDLMKVSFSNKGGKITNVELKDYKRFNGEPLMMAAQGSTELDLSYYIQKDFHTTELNTSDYYFTVEQKPASVVGGDEELVSMKLYIDSASYMEYLYVIKKDDYMMDFKVRFFNMENILANQSDMTLTWDAIGLQQEKGFENENNYSSIAYKYPGKSSIEDIGRDKASRSKTEEGRVHWVAFKQQFFSSIFIADNNFQDAVMKYDTYVPTDNYLKNFHASMRLAFSPTTSEYGFQIYYGPNRYSTLNQYDDLNLQRLVPLGWGIFGWINRYAVIPIFDFLSSRIASFGIIILILTILLRLVVFPFTYKSYLSGAKMRLLKPELDVLNEKYPKQEDAMKKQQEMMGLYKKAGVNPMGGCLPMLIQMPIFIAMFRFFPASIELRGQSFLWAEDLSSYDSIIDLPFNIPLYGDHVSLFTLLMAIMLYLSSRFNLEQQSAPTAPGMGGMKYMMLYFMPLMLLVMFNNYASGLTYYYFLSTTIAVLQMLAFRYLVNDDKLHAKMKANAKKKNGNKKKSKWQQRYEEMLKQQQELQKKQGKR